MTGPIKPFTFLQVSDVHLDSKLASTKLALPATKRQERNQEILAALVRSLDLAREREVDAVLIPGDLWDSESVTSQTINRLIEALMTLGQIPVVIAPGNHDYCAGDSLYEPKVLAARGMRPWPENVHVFRSPEFTTWQHPRRPDVAFSGRAFTSNVPVRERLLAAPVPKLDAAAINILLFHGSLDGYTGGDSGWPGKQTAPFSSAELASLGFNYAAIGHYHDFTEIRAERGRLLGAYSGCLVGRGFDEAGPRYALLGTITSREDDPPVSSLEKIEIDQRRLILAACDITGRTSEAVLEEVAETLAEAGARKQADLVHLRLEGRHHTGAEPDYVLEQLKDAYYHLVVEDDTRPDYLTEKVDRRTTEGRFIQAMLELKAKAEASGGALPDSVDGLPLTTRVIEDALYYGLDALKQKRVLVRHVD